jgi:hypothetical protein
VAEFLAAVDVTQVDFDRRKGYSGYRVTDGVGIVCERAGIHQQAVGPQSRVVNLIDQHTFVITLNRPNLIVGAGRGNQFLVDSFQSYVPVNRPFARPQQIQVWAVKHQNFSHK